jgi:hypothetical protein
VRFLNRKLWPSGRPVAQGRLSRLVAQTAVDPDLRARDISTLPDATRRYAIFFVARSGRTCCRASSISASRGSISTSTWWGASLPR